MALQEFDAEAGVLARRRALAQSLMSQPAPQGRMVGRVYVGANPLEQLAHGLRQVAGTKDLQAADSAEIQLQQRRQAQGAEDAKRFAEILRGKPSETIQSPVVNDDDGNVMPVAQTQAVPGDAASAYAFALGSQSPMIRQMGAQGMAQLPQIEARNAERAADREFRAQQLQQQHQMRMEQMAAQNASRQEMMRAQQEFQRQMVELKQSFGGSGGQPYFQPVQTAQGVFSFNARTGKMEPVAVNGAPVIGAQADPKLQGEIAASKEAGKSGVEQGVERNKAVRKSDQMLSVLDQAEGLLKQGPTNSGVGALVDKAGGAVGLSSKSAQTAGQLETLSGWLVANVPRMEGPQSNMDVQNYTTMAGMVGDRTKPVAERMAALRTVRELQQKYKALNQDGQSPSASAPAAGPRKVIRFDANGNRIQ